MALDRISNEFDFAAVIDVDEFINLKRHNSIKEFLENYTNVCGVVLNWFLFGDSGLKSVNDGNYSCVNRFVNRSKNVHDAVKTIYNLHEIRKLNIKLDGRVAVHCPKSFKILNMCMANGSKYDLANEKDMLVENGKTSCEIAYINHYARKTLEEYRAKYERNANSMWERNNRWKFNGIEGRF